MILFLCFMCPGSCQPTWPVQSKATPSILSDLLYMLTKDIFKFLLLNIAVVNDMSSNSSNYDLLSNCNVVGIVPIMILCVFLFNHWKNCARWLHYSYFSVRKHRLRKVRQLAKIIGQWAPELGFEFKVYFFHLVINKLLRLIKSSKGYINCFMT